MVNSQPWCVSLGLEQRAQLKWERRYLQTMAFCTETMWLLSDSHLLEIWELFQQMILPDCFYSCAASSLEATQSVNFSPTVPSLSLYFGEKKRLKRIQLQLRLMLVWHYFGLTGGTSFVWGEVWHSGCDLLQGDDCRDVRERLRVGGSCLEFILFPKSWLKIWLIPLV